jgi:hypothetical protein
MRVLRKFDMPLAKHAQSEVNMPTMTSGGDFSAKIMVTKQGLIRNL